ncbi:MAG: hypothetical protein U0228_25780 [Myxococcaceae bacterium]
MRRVFAVVLAVLGLTALPLLALRTLRGPITIEGHRALAGAPFDVTLTTRGLLGNDVRRVRSAKATLYESPSTDRERGFIELQLEAEEGLAQPVLSLPLARGPPPTSYEPLAGWAYQFNDAARSSALDVRVELPAESGYEFLKWATAAAAVLGLAIGLGLRRPRPS